MNPLKDIITDETFEQLKPFFNEIALRNHSIRQEFKSMRQDGMRAELAIDAIQCKNPSVTFDTIRKIVYNKDKA